LTRKEQQITELYLNTTLEVAQSVDNWLSFLKSASYNYKYRFDEQVLIYAQKPEATACAETTIWNKKMKRWINKGSKGIALMTDNNGEMGLRFVFDVSDTNSNVYGRKFKLWTAEEKYTDEVIETLEETFGTIGDKSDLANAILDTAFRNIQENMQDYLEELKDVLKNSNLEKVNEEQIEYSFRNMLMFSTVSLILFRCGIEPSRFFGESDFADIKYFNTFETISILGTATRDFSKEILLEISKTIINVQKKEKNINRTFVKENIKDYDKNIKDEKGSVEHEQEYNIYNERGLPNTRSSSTRESEQESGIRQIRTHEVELPKSTQEGNIHDIVYEQQINRPLDRDTGNSQEENKRDSGTNEKDLWNNRGIESTRPDGMDRTDEQHTSNSRADSSERVNIQLNNKELAEKLNDFFQSNDIFDTSEDNRTDEEKIRDIEDSLNNIVDISNTIKYLEEVKKAEDDNIELNTEIDYFINELKQIYSKLQQDNEKEADNASFFDEETIKNILKNAPNVTKNKTEFGQFIYENYEDKEKCKQYIKEVLGNAYTEFDVDNQRVGYRAKEDTLNIWKGNYLNREEECFKSWDLITEYCIANEVHFNTPEYNKDTYTFMIGDSIFLGLQEFIILDLDNGKMTMYDKQFPLDQRTVVIKDLMLKIAENPMNDYLKEREIPEIKEDSFNKWLDTFIEEKGIDLNDVVEITTNNNTHFFEIGNIVEHIKATTKEEQTAIKDMIVKIDFHNGDVIDYLKHLAKALADNFEKQFEQQDKAIVDEVSKKISNQNRNIEYFDLHPEIPTEERNNFKIKDDNLGVGTLKEKFRNNIEAIKVLKLCEEQNRYATVEEQEILSKYVGWGGLKSAFEKDNNSWSEEYYELKNLLTEEEYKNARESSLTAYYTPPVVIRNIYKALQNMGLKQANILEPSCRSW